MVYTFSKDVAIYLYIIFDLSYCFLNYTLGDTFLLVSLCLHFTLRQKTLLLVLLFHPSPYVIKENIAILVLFIFYALLIDSIDSTFQCKLFFNLYTNVSLQSVWAHFVIFAGADLSVPFNQSHFCVGKR